MWHEWISVSYTVLDDLANRVELFLSRVASVPEAPAELTKAILLLLVPALLAMAAYLGKLIIEGLIALRADYRKFRSAIIRHVYDVEIWKRDFSVRFTPDRMDALVTKLVEAPPNFKFGLASSDDEEDANEIDKHLHWLRSEEIYTLRQFRTYSELFESAMLQISGDDFAKFDLKRKLEAFLNALEIGFDTFKSAEAALKATRSPNAGHLVAFSSWVGTNILALFLARTRSYVNVPKSLSLAGPSPADTLSRDEQTTPPMWRGAAFNDFKKRSLALVEAKSNKGG